MDFELWYLVFVPLLFAAGWWFRGLDARQRRMETHGLDENYFKGLSLLISDKPEKVIDHFMEVMRLDSETIELHHSLGNLFRERGQFDQAIRIHTNLVNRAELPDSERMLALSELAQDFVKAGTFDRAQSAYEMLRDSSPERREEALAALMRIFMTEKDWAKAIETAEIRSREFKTDLSHEVSHFYCEMAAASRRAGDAARTAELIDKALHVNPKNVRALIMAADAALASGDTAVAQDKWSRIETEAPKYTPLIAAKKADVLAATDPKAALAYLKDVFARTGSADVLSATVTRLNTWENAAAAGDFAVAALKQRPSMSAFAVLCGVKKQQEPENDEAALLADLTAKQSKRSGRYQCRKCGFLSHTFMWQCPGCETWDAFPPQRIEEG